MFHFRRNIFAEMLFRSILTLLGRKRSTLSFVDGEKPTLGFLRIEIVCVRRSRM